ncbi:MAG TPA: mechanosensitive ion channel family protein, partial [Steroidobacteraceae bacterium]|nr:mechanosensitive ion channel family protein [Steroidobacteraceae bacterium]
MQILDETVDWYRTLGAQQQNATQPSDQILFFANRQIADKVIALTFEVARANAELLSSEASAAQSSDDPSRSPQALAQREQSMAQKAAGIDKEMQSVRSRLPAASGRTRSDLNDKLSALQGELSMVKAQQNLLGSMSTFVYQNDPKRAGVSALKARIDAIAATIPAAASSTGSAAATTSPAGAAAAFNSVPSTAASGVTLRELGIWDLGAEALRLSQKLRTIDALDHSTGALKETFQKIQSAPSEQLHKLSAQSDELATAADSASGPALKSLRDQFDTLAWLFTQTSGIALPLGKINVLLMQYRDNLSSWRASVKRQRGDVFRALGVRLAVLFGALAAVFVGSEIWRRAVLRYVRDPRYRNQLLLVRRIVTWVLVLLILAFTFITQLSSFATFVGLLTAGLAVAMQSVLVSVVGYFVLIGKYGLRVGDRVQVGGVNGELVELGLIRMHLLELTPKGALGPTGRVVSFPNSIVFQTPGGLFKQIPGVNFGWHELTVDLPPGSDFVALKDRLLAKLNAVIDEYRGDIARQAETMRQTTSWPETTDVTPQVQLQYSTSGVQAIARYPVPLDRAAEVDERVSRALHEVVPAALAPSAPAPQQPAP